MMRKALLWASTNPFLAGRLPTYSFVKRATARFMPGEDVEDALAEADALSEGGICAIVTLLGENLTSESEADEVVEHYLKVLADIDGTGIGTQISVKPTQLGLDFGAPRTLERLMRLVTATSSRVWIDMESSAYVDRTLELFRQVRQERENVGVALQSYLRRTRDDLEGLLSLDPSIRLVKGAYSEPPNIAFAKKSEVDRNYVQLAGTLLRARARGRQGDVVIATHDPRMIAEAMRMAHELGLDPKTYELAMLYGIQTAQQTRLAHTGHRVRVLISYGSAWFPWYMRRLAERPANVWFVLKQLLG
jgi:proline dehydrogenase